MLQYSPLVGLNCSSVKFTDVNFFNILTTIRQGQNIPATINPDSLLAAPSLVTVRSLPFFALPYKKMGFGPFIAVVKVGKDACLFHLQETF
jgi:hypothetical protein